MLELTEAQLVEVILVAARRGYKQALEDAEKTSARRRDECAQEGVSSFRENALKVMRDRLAELKELKANELLVAGFNEAIEYLEFGVDKDWLTLRGEGGGEA
jgi:hypothetical protein